jgi:arginine-tRNA-protein transferase
VKQSAEKSLEDWLKDISPNSVNKFEVSVFPILFCLRGFDKGYVQSLNKEKICISFQTRLVRSNPRSKLFNDTFSESHAVYQKYQMQIHHDPPEKPSAKQFTRFLVDSPLEVLVFQLSFSV